MVVDSTTQAFSSKALESLAGAGSEHANRRYNNCANRCYYACFQAAVAALLMAGIRPEGGRGQWGHEFVQGQFVGQLINRRKLYPGALRDALARLLILRQTGDYQDDGVTEIQAGRALRRAEAFVEAVEAVKAKGGESR